MTRWELLAGVALDLIVGDPHGVPHPVRGIGWLTSTMEMLLRRTGIPLRIAGVLLCVCVVTASSAVVWLTLPWVDVYWVYSLLSLRSLDTESKRVVDTLETGNLDLARARLAMIVGRDTASLNTSEIMRAVIETVAENVNDGVIAPLFYLALLGPAGMAAYKAANTLDSMVGHKNKQYADLGWASARFDDMLNFIPARLSALLVWIAAGFLGMSTVRSIRVTLRDAGSQPSPNAGWPEAAFAGAIGVQLGGVELLPRGAKGKGIPRRFDTASGYQSFPRNSSAAVRFVIIDDCRSLAMVLTHGGNLFEAARTLGCDWRDILDFSASINPLGPADGVRQAIDEALDRIAHYPDRHAFRLQNVLAAEWNVEPDRILLGNGATELIHFLARIWQIETTLITPVFSEFHRAYPKARLNTPGGEGLLVITNPVNPTGAASELPDHSGPILIDESFIEFSDLPTQMRSGYIVLRSMTKFHALPGLRIGALVGPGELLRKWREKREPWQVNVLAEAAAIAALGAKDHHRKTREFVLAERARLWDLYRTVPGVHLYPTHANYYFAQLNYSAARLCRYMYRNRVLLRDCSGWSGIDGQAVRFAIRTCEENDKLLALWRTYPCD